MSNPVSTYQQIICHSFMLEREGSCYLIKENKKGASNRLLRIHASKSIGFSLDRNGNRWDFFASGSLPKGIASVSDGIIFCEVENKYYAIIVDMKSKHKSNGASQVRSSFAFCEWLNSLIHIHSASIGFDCQLIGVICLTGRNIPTKKGTKKGIEPDGHICCGGNYIFTIKNPGTISASDIISWVE